jgi:hypothetical protein
MSTTLLFDDQTLRRICGEFLEMPGLQLTSRQAQRLWGLDEGVCAGLLESLVEAKFLCRRGHDSYARLTDGRVESLPLAQAPEPVAVVAAGFKRAR